MAHGRYDGRRAAGVDGELAALTDCASRHLATMFSSFISGTNIGGLPAEVRRQSMIR